MPSKRRRGGSWTPRLRAGADRDRRVREPRCTAAHAAPARPGGCSRGGRVAEGAAPTTAVGGRSAGGREAACGGLEPQHGPRRRERTNRTSQPLLRAERHGGGPSARTRPPGRRAMPSSRRRPLLPPLTGPPACPPGTRPAPPLAAAHRAEADPGGWLRRHLE